MNWLSIQKIQSRAPIFSRKNNPFFHTNQNYLFRRSNSYFLIYSFFGCINLYQELLGPGHKMLWIGFCTFSHIKWKEGAGVNLLPKALGARNQSIVLRPCLPLPSKRAGHNKDRQLLHLITVNSQFYGRHKSCVPFYVCRLRRTTVFPHCIQTAYLFPDDTRRPTTTNVIARKYYAQI